MLFNRERIINQYLILISPKGSLDKYVLDLKSWYRDNFGGADKLHSGPHISLCSFLLDEENEKSLRTELKRYFSGRSALKAKTDGIKAFSGNRLVSVAVDSPMLKLFQREMVQILKKVVKVSGRYLKKLDYPHFTIAHSSNDSDFEKVKKILDQTEHGSMSFEIKEIQIFKKPIVRNARYELIETISLN